MSTRREQPGAEKSPDAFRTISEVAEDLDLPQHVLRFWETRFPQIRPLKRGGGRRYYRPDDVELLRGIRHLLYGEGYTIRGVQRILKEEGPRYVQAIWRDVEAEEQAIAALEERPTPAPTVPAPAAPMPPARIPEDAPPRSGPLGGILNLLPGRPREGAEEPPARRARRRSENEPDHLELPLLADLEPPVRAPRDERPAERPSPAEPPRMEPPRLDQPRPGNGEPARSDLRAGDSSAPEPRTVEPRMSEPRTAEARVPFSFRPVVSERAGHEDEGGDFAPPRARTAPQSQATPSPVRPAASAVPTPPRADGVQGDEPPARTRLSREDVQRLQAALYELQDCQRLLDAARDRGD